MLFYAAQGNVFRVALAEHVVVFKRVDVDLRQSKRFTPMSGVSIARGFRHNLRFLKSERLSLSIAFIAVLGVVGAVYQSGRQDGTQASVCIFLVIHFQCIMLVTHLGLGWAERRAR